MSVDDASALEETLSRLRQRYALYFHLPENATPGEERSISVDLSPAARRRYTDAEIRFRRVYLAPDGPVGGGRTMVTRAPARVPAEGNRTATLSGDDRPVVRRRVAVDEPDGPRINMSGAPSEQSSPVEQPASSEVAKGDDANPKSGNAPKPVSAQAAKPGWRRASDPLPPESGPGTPVKPPGQQ